LAAYRRLRLSGHQPHGIDGCADLERQLTKGEVDDAPILGVHFWRPDEDIPPAVRDRRDYDTEGGPLPGFFGYFLDVRRDDWWFSGAIYQRDDGRLIVERLLIEPGPQAQDEGVNTTVLRTVPIGQLVASIVTRIQQDAKARAQLEGRGFATDETTAAEDAAERAAGATGRFTDAQLERFALAALAEVAKGAGSRERLAEQFSVSQSTIVDMYRAAQLRGFVTKGVRGSRVRGPGPRLQALMQDRSKATQQAPARRKRKG